jgi:CHAD domain-containing protein
VNETATFLIPDSVRPETRADGFAERHPIRRERPRRERRTYFDTYDWSLYHSGLALSQSGHDYSLWSLEDNAVIRTVPQNASEPLDFLRAFGDVLMRGKLRKTMAIRALIPRGCVDSEVQTLCVLDDLEKTVSRVRVEVIKTDQASPITVVSLQPVRGYPEQNDEVSRLLDGLGSLHSASQIFDRMQGAAGESPSQYPSDKHVQLQPDMPAHAAARAILERMLAVILKNERGIREDIDTECLHDFRVAVRRTRAALAQIKYVFPSEAVDTFTSFFRELGRSSNDLRDLDVYLLDRERFEQMLPEEWRPRLGPLFKLLQSERERCHAAFVTRLDDPATRKGLTDWEAFLDRPPSTAAPPKNAGKPVMKVARKAIRKRYRLVIQAGNAINDSSPGKELHKLRLHCKKLRYLLEFFASLFPEETMTLLIGQLKSLQDNLGEFCDLAVQRPKLNSFIGRLSAQGEQSKDIAAAVGGLTAVLYRRQQDVRAGFDRTFREFSATDNADLYSQLFG